MIELYKSKYYSNFESFRKNGWTDQEINTYFPLLESLNEKQLLELYTMCQIKMFASEKEVDKEQAIHVLVNPNDTPKVLLIEALKKLIN